MRAFKHIILCASALGLAWAAPAPAQQRVSDGTYVVEGGSYSIDVRMEGDALVVVEPNKTSRYARQPDGSYQFYNDNTQATYSIRALDDQTIEALNLDSGNAPTVLVRLGGPPPAPAVAPAPVAAAPAPARARPNDEYGAIAKRYQELAQTDPDNAQTWTACSAAALKRSLANDAEAERYAREMAQVLKLILVDPGRTPCADAIPPRLWSVGVAADAASAATAAAPQPPAPRQELDAAEQQRLAELNARADARLEAGKAEAARREAEEQAYRRRLAEVQAAEQKFARDRAAYEAELARAKAAEAEYQRQLEEHRRLLESGNYIGDD